MGGELERLEDFINLDNEKVDSPANFSKVVKVDQFEAAETQSQASTLVPSSTSSSSTAKSFDDAEINSVLFNQVPCSGVGTRARFQSDLSWSDLSEEAVARIPLSLDSFFHVGVQTNPAKAAASVETSNDTEKTTLMFRHLPEWFTRQKLELLLKEEGFGMMYDFIYLPAELGSGNCFGYAFVNMVTPKDAELFIEHFQGFDRWPEPHSSRAVVHLSEALQGLNEQIERYRNSPLMHPSVSDDLRPAIYSQGMRTRFPAPTVLIKPPRVRTSTKKKMPLRGHSKSDL